jgi:hypothetical protein
VPRRGSARDDARRRALQAKAARDQARKLREEQIANVLADYYLAVAQAGRLREQARAKADAALADGEKAARVPDASAAQNVGLLRDLLGGIPEVAELCDLSQAAVRELLATAKATDGGTRTPARRRGAGPLPGVREHSGAERDDIAEWSDPDGH